MNTQTQTTELKATTIFKNLYAAIIAEYQQEMDTFEKDLLNNYKNVDEVLSSWYYNELLPKGKQKGNYKWEVKTLIPYLINRKAAKIEKSVAQKLAHLQAVENAGDLESITVSVEWTKSRMWGNNPKADARVCDKQYGHNYESERVGGCGYDKESTAIAQAINQSPEFLKQLYIVKDARLSAQPTVKNSEIFGYGSGYGVLPRLEGGVGVSCYRQIFETIGFEWHNTASGKTFDVYTATKK